MQPGSAANSAGTAAAAYAIGIVKNHPFVDGNNRTGFMTNDDTVPAVRLGPKLTGQYALWPEPKQPAITLS